MIKIINDKPHPSVIKQSIYPSCGVMLEYTPKDISAYYIPNYAKDFGCGKEDDWYEQIQCPKCNHFHTIRKI